MKIVSLCLCVGACGGGGGSSPAPIQVGDLSAITNEDVSVAINVSANNAVSSSTRVIVESNPSFGSLTLGYPEIVYAPNSNANGADSFRVRLQDGTRESRVFTIELTINPVNDAPQVNTNTPGSITAFTEYVFDLQTSDADDDPVTYAVKNLPAWLQLDAQAGVLRGTPNNAQVGLYENIEISVSDGLETTLVPMFDIDVLFEPLVAKAIGFPSLGFENPSIIGLLVFGNIAVAKVSGVDALNQRVVALGAIDLLTLETLWSFVDQPVASFDGAFVDIAKYSDGFVTIRRGRIQGYSLAGDLQFDHTFLTNSTNITSGGITELADGDFLISVNDNVTQVAELIRLNTTTGAVSTQPQPTFYLQLAGTSPNELFGAGLPGLSTTSPFVQKFAETAGVIWTGAISGSITEVIEPITVLADGSVQITYVGTAAGAASVRYSTDGVELLSSSNNGDDSAVATRDDGSIEIVASERREPVYSSFAADGVKTARIFLDSAKFESVLQAVTHPLYNVLLVTDGAVLRSLSPTGELR